MQPTRGSHLAVDLLIYYKNNASGRVAGVGAAGRREVLLSPTRAVRPAGSTPAARGAAQAGGGWAGRPLPYLCTCRTKACTSWIRGSWLSGLALERAVDLP